MHAIASQCCNHDCMCLVQRRYFGGTLIWLVPFGVGDPLVKMSVVSKQWSCESLAAGNDHLLKCKVEKRAQLEAQRKAWDWQKSYHIPLVDWSRNGSIYIYISSFIQRFAPTYTGIYFYMFSFHTFIRYDSFTIKGLIFIWNHRGFMMPCKGTGRPAQRASSIWLGCWVRQTGWRGPHLSHILIDHFTQLMFYPLAHLKQFPNQLDEKIRKRDQWMIPNQLPGLTFETRTIMRGCAHAALRLQNRNFPWPPSGSHLSRRRQHLSRELWWRRRPVLNQRQGQGNTYQRVILHQPYDTFPPIESTMMVWIGALGLLYTLQTLHQVQPARMTSVKSKASPPKPAEEPHEIVHILLYIYSST